MSIPDANVEKQIIVGLIVSDEFCKRIVPILKSDLNYIQLQFVRDVAGWCVDYWYKYEKPIEIHIVDEYLKKGKQRLKKENAELIVEFLDGLSSEYEKKKEKFNPDYVFDESLKYFRLTDAKNLIQQIDRNIKSGKIEKIEKSVADFQALKSTTNNVEIENVKQNLKDSKTVYLVSQEKHILRLEWIVGDAEKVIMVPETLPKDYEQCFSDKEVVIVTTGTENKNVNTLKMVLPNTATGLKVIDIPFLEKEGGLFNEHMKNGDELTQYMYQNRFGWELDENPDLVKTRLDRALESMIMPFEDFYRLHLPLRETILYPWIQENDLIVISGDVGVGKTWFTMELCAAIQNNRGAMGGLWKTRKIEDEETKLVKTLYCDGEQHYGDIKKIGKLLNFKSVHILTKSYLEYCDIYPSLNLNESDVRDLLFDQIIKNGYKFVVLDNLFSLWAGINLDSAQEWHEPNQWLLKLRSKGVSVVLIHHLNKAGRQIGTQAKLFNINTALILVGTKPQPVNAEGERIVSFSIKTEKMRAKGKGLEGYIFKCDDGVWTVTEKEESAKEDDKADTKELIVALLLDGKIKPQSKIGSLVNCSQSNVAHVKKDYEHLFNKDKSANREGKSFLSEHSNLLDDFYEKHGIQ